MFLISIKTLKNLQIRINKPWQNLNKEFCIGLHGETPVGFSVVCTALLTHEVFDK